MVCFRSPDRFGCPGLWDFPKIGYVFGVRHSCMKLDRVPFFRSVPWKQILETHSGNNLNPIFQYSKTRSHAWLILIGYDTARNRKISWWRHQVEAFSALLVLCAGNSPVTGEFPTQRAVTRTFDVFFELRLNKQLNKQSWGWWFETLDRAHYDVSVM